MSVEKTAAAGDVPASIRFYYETEKMFNSLSLRTSYRAKMIKDTEGVSQTDDVAISQDEKDIVKELLEQAVYDIFGEMFKITEGIADPIFFDTTFTPKGGASELTVSGGILKDNEAFNANILTNIDKKIENCIRYFILTQWYVVCALGTDAKLNQDQYTDYLRQVKNLTFQLRKPLMS